MFKKRSLLQEQSDTFIVGYLVVSAAGRPEPLCAIWRCSSLVVLIPLLQPCVPSC